MWGITQDELAVIDPEIRYVIDALNSLQYVRTVYSCAGYGLSGERGVKHSRSETKSAYLLVEYDLLTGEWEDIHTRLTDISVSARLTAADKCAFYFGSDSVTSVKLRWRRIYAAVKTIIAKRDFIDDRLARQENAAAIIQYRCFNPRRPQLPEVRRSSPVVYPPDNFDPVDATW